MDILSHATIGAGTAMLIFSTKDPTIAAQGAFMGILPDILGVPITEGYHLFKARFNIFSAKKIIDVFKFSTTQRWGQLPSWINSYYHFLHSFLFVLITTAVLMIISPVLISWAFVLLIAHILPDVFLHKDESRTTFKHGIRPFWPLQLSVQVCQWYNLKYWAKIPLIPIVIQIIFWAFVVIL